MSDEKWTLGERVCLWVFLVILFASALALGYLAGAGFDYLFMS